MSNLQKKVSIRQLFLKHKSTMFTLHLFPFSQFSSQSIHSINKCISIEHKKGEMETCPSKRLLVLGMPYKNWRLQRQVENFT